MSILIDSSTRALVQGISGRMARLVTRDLIEFGTRIVGGVVPGKAGQVQDGVPIFDSVAEAVAETAADASIVFVPASSAREATLEALEAGVDLVVYSGDGLPVQDSVRMRRAARQAGATLIGPNTPGIISPGGCKLGFMPTYCFAEGPVGVVSKSGSLSYETSWRLTGAGLGQSTVIGVGGDPVKGVTIGEALALFEQDAATEAVVVLGEIGGTEEYEIVRYIEGGGRLPIVSIIVGRTAPRGRKLGHAGALVGGDREAYEAKVDALEASGAAVARGLGEIPTLVADALGRPVRA